MVARLAALLGLLLLARLGWAQYDPLTEAKKHFERAETAYKLGQFPTAIEGYEATFRLTKSPLMLYNIAQSHRRQYDVDGVVTHLTAAREHYQRFLDALPKTPLRGKIEGYLAELGQQIEALAKRHFQQAETAYRIGKFTQAIAGYEDAYALLPKPEILYNLGQAHRKQYALDGKVERLRAAREIFRTYLREIPESPQKVRALEILREVEGAVAEHERRARAEQAIPEPEQLRAARRAYDAQDYVAARAALTAALGAGGTRREHLVSAYRLLGHVAALTGDAEGAAEAFKRYLALEPAGAVAADAPEKVASAFAAAKDYWNGRDRMRLEHLPPGRVPPATALYIPITIPADPLKMIQRLAFLYRRAGEPAYERQLLVRAEGGVQLPASYLGDRGKPYRVEYYVQALDEHGGIVDSLGSDGAPLAFLVTPEVGAVRWYQRWWVWAIAGTVAASGSVVAALLATRGTGYPAVDIPTHQSFRLGVGRW